MQGIYFLVFAACVSVDAARDFSVGVDFGSLRTLDATLADLLLLRLFVLCCESADAASVFSVGDADLLAKTLPALLATFAKVFSTGLFFDAIVISLLQLRVWVTSEMVSRYANIS